MLGLAKGIAGFGALVYVAYRVWQQLARVEPIDVFPLLRPFAIGLCLMFFPTMVIGTINTVLSPVTRSCSFIVDSQIGEAQALQTRKDDMEREALSRDPTKVYMVDDEEFDRQLDELGILDSPQILGMHIMRMGYKSL
jgi:conjugative transposon TraJ protein